MKKLAAILAVVGLGLAGFAGTCNLLQMSLTQIGSTDTYAGALQNNTGANFLSHKFKVAFVDFNGNIVDQRTNVSGCLRSWQNGTSDFFSVASIQPATSTANAIGSLDFSQPLTGGTTVATSSTVSNVAASLNSTTLTVTGTLRNNDGVSLVQPNVCAVVYNSSGNILVTQMSSLGDLGTSTSTNFTMSITVPGSTVTSSTVTVWADGFENGVPTAPISSVSTVVSAGANHLAFTTQPSSANVGVVFPTQPVVVLRDQLNNTVTSSSASVTLTLSGGTTGAVLTCTQVANTVVAVNGIATFSGCSVNTAGSNYVLTASSAGATGAVSNAFNIGAPGVPFKVAFTAQPSGAAAGAALATQPVVQIQDAGSSLVTTATNSVTLTVAPGSTAGGLTCTTTVAAVNGVATFSGCALTTAGPGSLLAQSSGLNQDTSQLFTITPGAATKLAFKPNTPSTTATTGVAFVAQPVVLVQDASGNTVTTSSAAVVLAKATGPGTLTCTQAANTVVAVNGVATFSGCSLTGAGAYTLTATSGSLTPPTLAASITVS